MHGFLVFMCYSLFLHTKQLIICWSVHHYVFIHNSQVLVKPLCSAKYNNYHVCSMLVSIRAYIWILLLTSYVHNNYLPSYISYVPTPITLPLLRMHMWGDNIIYSDTDCHYQNFVCYNVMCSNFNFDSKQTIIIASYVPLIMNAWSSYNNHNLCHATQ